MLHAEMITLCGLLAKGVGQEAKALEASRCSTEFIKDRLNTSKEEAIAMITVAYDASRQALGDRGIDGLLEHFDNVLTIYLPEEFSV
jgi:hypothetical protein